MNTEVTTPRPAITLLHALETCLHAERQALIEQDLERLAAVAADKAIVLGQLMRDPIGRAAADKSVEPDPDALAALRRCQDLSVGNQGLIERGRRQVEIALRMLRGGETAHCYTRRAHTESQLISAGRTLATV